MHICNLSQMIPHRMTSGNVMSFLNGFKRFSLCWIFSQWPYPSNCKTRAIGQGRIYKMTFYMTKVALEKKTTVGTFNYVFGLDYIYNTILAHDKNVYFKECYVVNTIYVHFGISWFHTTSISASLICMETFGRR